MTIPADLIQPKGKLTVRVLAMPADTNPAGDVFGGWVLSQMDIAGGLCAAEHSHSRVVTVAVESMSFIRPVHVGDVLAVYTEVLRVGTTSMTVHVEAWARRRQTSQHEKVTEANFKFVALDQSGRPMNVPRLPE